MSQGLEKELSRADSYSAMQKSREVHDGQIPNVTNRRDQKWTDLSGGRERKWHGIELNTEEGLEHVKPCGCWEVGWVSF